MENDEHFRKAFMFFDKDGSGYIELDELREALADESGACDTDVLNEIMREVDTDKVRLIFFSPCSDLPLSLALSICFKKQAKRLLNIKEVRSILSNVEPFRVTENSPKKEEDGISLGM